MQRFKDFLDSKYFVAVCFVLLIIIAFSLGRLSKIEEGRESVRVIQAAAAGAGEIKRISTPSPNSPLCGGKECSAITGPSGRVVASKNGTKYHYPWCAGARQISESNKVVFNSIEEARAKGYTPASNCKGLK